MSYTIIAERRSLSIYNRAATAVAALDCAVARRRNGADAVFVRDKEWNLVPAPILERAAEVEREGRASLGTSMTIKNGNDLDPSAGRPGPRSGRVRVFKAGGMQRCRG